MVGRFYLPLRRKEDLEKPNVLSYIKAAAAAAAARARCLKAFLHSLAPSKDDVLSGRGAPKADNRLHDSVLQDRRVSEIQTFHGRHKCMVPSPFVRDCNHGVASTLMFALRRKNGSERH